MSFIFFILLMLYNVYKYLYDFRIWKLLNLCVWDLPLNTSKQGIKINSSWKFSPLHQIIRGYNMDMPSTKNENIKLWKKQNTYGFPIQSWGARRACLSGAAPSGLRGPNQTIHPRLSFGSSGTSGTRLSLFHLSKNKRNLQKFYLNVSGGIIA